MRLFESQSNLSMMFSAYFIFFCITFVDRMPHSLGLRRSETYPPKELLKLVQPFHDLCVRMTNTPEASISEFSDGDVNIIDQYEKDDRLKCYMYCFLHELEHYDLPAEYDEMDFFEKEDTEALIEMYKKCKHLEYDTHPGVRACDHAFELEKCWKKANPEYYFLM